MSDNPLKLGPIDGLLQYVQRDVKPYHTKIVEVLVEYLTNDSICVGGNPTDITCDFERDKPTAIIEDLQIAIQLGQGNLTSTFRFRIFSVDTTTLARDTIHLKSSTGNAADYIDIYNNFWPGMQVDIAESYNGQYPLPQEFLISGYNHAGYFIIPGNQTAHFPAGKHFTVEGLVNNSGPFVAISSNTAGGATRVHVDSSLPGTFSIITGKSPMMFIEPGNTGRYTIKSLGYDHTLKTTKVIFDQSLPYATMQNYVVADELVRTGALGHVCLDAIQYRYPLKAGCRLPRRLFPCANTFGDVYDPGLPQEESGGFDVPALDTDGFDNSTTSSLDTIQDPNAPYDIIDTDAVTNHFIVAGDQRDYFPHGRQFRVRESANNNRQYNVLIALLNAAGDTRIYVTEDILYPFGGGATDGHINTPGYAHGRFLYGFGYDQPKLCSAVPELHLQTVFAERLVIEITDTAVPEAEETGWELLVWDGFRWDTDEPSDGTNVSFTLGYDPTFGAYDDTHGYDPE